MLLAPTYRDHAMALRDISNKARIMATYAEKSHLFSQAVIYSPDAGSDNASNHMFRGHCVDCIDLRNTRP